MDACPLHSAYSGCCFLYCGPFLCLHRLNKRADAPGLAGTIHRSIENTGRSDGPSQCFSRTSSIHSTSISSIFRRYRQSRVRWPGMVAAEIRPRIIPYHVSRTAKLVAASAVTAHRPIIVIYRQLGLMIAGLSRYLQRCWVWSGDGGEMRRRRCRITLVKVSMRRQTTMIAGGRKSSFHRNTV